MRRLRTMPLRLRLTVLMAMILTLACIVLMLAAIYVARQVYHYDFAQGSEIIRGPIDELPQGSRLQIEFPREIMVRQDNDFASIGIVIAVIIIVLGTGLTYIIAGRALRPVTSLSKEIEEIDEHRLFRQVEVALSGDEVARLALSFNRMIQKLEKAFLAHRNFSANAAHELKTPLAAMIANIEVLQLDANPTLADYKETLDDTLSNAQRLSGLVNDLLKMNVELSSAACERFEAEAMFEQIANDFQKEIRGKNIRVENLTGNGGSGNGDNKVRLYGDKQLLARAFSNLVHNAIKYNKPDGVVKITAAETGDRTRVTIVDTGIGIPEDQLDKIFDPFYCVDKSRSRALGGSGLGLAIVKSVIEKHGGDIQVRSEPDIYTSVVVILPKR